MKWRDLLYFSKGERRALTLLLCLITIAGILLLINDQSDSPEDVPEIQYIVNPQNAPVAVAVDTTLKKESVLPQQEKQVKKSNSFKNNNTKRTYNSYPKTEKYAAGTVVELNTADTTILKKVPGIGSVFARRIVNYRNLLGGFYTVSQLKEVFGMEEERYLSLHKWFYVDTAFIAKLPVNYLVLDSLLKHPYINYKQAKTITQIRKQKSRLSGWENLLLLDEFSESDRRRLENYFAF